MASLISAGTATNTALNITGDTTGVLALATNNGTTALTITTAQNVGIGTSSPGTKLQVQGGARLGSASGSAFTGALTTSGLDVMVGSGAGTAGAFQVWDDNSLATPRFMVTRDGNVGIGLSTTNTTLHVQGATTTDGSIKFNEQLNSSGAYNATPMSGTLVALKYNTAGDYAGMGGWSIGKENGTDGNYSSYFGIHTRANGGAIGERARIDSAGNLIIADTSQQYSARLYASGSIAARNGGVDGTYADAFIAGYTSNYTEKNIIRTAVSSTAANSGFQFMVSDGAGLSTTTQSFRINRTSCTVVGSLSKGSGAFKIDHPLPAKTDTHHLVHSFIEGPQADLIYRGKVNLVAGTATVNIDTASGMTQGTFEVLCREVQCFTTNESDWTAVRGSVTGNILTIESQDNTSTASISWMVIGERKDKHMYDTEWTDENGKVIVEPLKISVETTDSNQGS